MTRAGQLLRPHVPRLVALGIVVALYSMARQPELSYADRARLAGRFQFTRHTLPELPEGPSRTIRSVHPSLERISAWISSVGAAVALNDLDGDGLPNDVACRRHPVAIGSSSRPCPARRSRFAPFVLDAAPLRYDPNTMAPMGCLPGDLNEDGLMDLLVYYWGRPPIAFLRRIEDGAIHAGLSDASFVRQESRAGRRSAGSRMPPRWPTWMATGMPT